MKYLFKTIIRNFTRKPVTNLINLLGLAISLTMVIILVSYCYSELTTDSHQENGDRIYIFGLTEEAIYTPGILREHIDMSIPAVEASLRIGGSWDAPVFQVEDREPLISDLIFADDNFFKLFTYNAVEGNLQTALTEPMSVVITKELSGRLFGKEKASGRLIKLNNSQELTVSAVIEAPEGNSCISFNAITSIETRKIVQEESGELTEWNQHNFQTFVLLKEGSDPKAVYESILTLFPEKRRPKYENQQLVPLKNIYFSKFMLFGSNYLLSGDRTKVMILVMVAFMVLIIAFINFINISSSQWHEKIRQTGVMKVLGASRYSILRGIVTESFLFFLTALLIALYLVATFSSIIYNYTGIRYDSNLTYSAGFIILSLLLTFLLSTLISIIPAARISSSRAVDNLKKTTRTNRTRFSFSGLLVTIQFTIAIGLIAFTLLVQKQIRFGSNSLGINQENIIGIKLTSQLNEKKDVVRKLLEDDPNVSQVSFSQYYPGKMISEWGTNLILNGEKKEISFNTFSADARLFEILGLQLKTGRIYSDNITSEKGKIIVNEKFLQANNITNPIGGTLDMARNGYTFEIVGVVNDFNYQAVNLPIAPLVIRNESYASYCIVSLLSKNFNALHTTVENIKKSVSELSPSFPVEVSFLDKAVQNMYQSELGFRRSFSLLSICAIILSSMGILAMSIFSCQRRIKEIGIRKANGARIVEILSMLNSEFGKWVLISFLISTPVAWYASQRWLEIFTYKTELSWWIFILAGFIALGIAVLTVSWQSLRAATRNPVEALRYE